MEKKAEGFFFGERFEIEIDECGYVASAREVFEKRAIMLPDGRVFGVTGVFSKEGEVSRVTFQEDVCPVRMRYIGGICSVDELEQFAEERGVVLVKERNKSLDQTDLLGKGDITCDLRQRFFGNDEEFSGIGIA